MEMDPGLLSRQFHGRPVLYRHMVQQFAFVAGHFIPGNMGREGEGNHSKELAPGLHWNWDGFGSRSQEFAANQERLFVGCLAYNLLHIIRDTAFRGKSVKPSRDFSL